MKATHNAKGATKKTPHESEILAFFDEHRTGVLSTVDVHGQPFAAVVYYTVDPSFTVKFQTKRSTKKSDNLTYNNHASLLVYDEAQQKTAQIRGTVREVASSEEDHELFRASLRASLHTSGNGVPPASKISAGEYVSYELTPSDVDMSIYS